MLAKIRNYILTGLIVVLPLSVTITVLSWVFIKLTNIVLRWIPSWLGNSAWMGLAVRLVIPVALLILLALVGLIAKVVFVKKLFVFGEKLLVKIPLFNKVYMAVKQISHAFLSKEKSIFKRVVLIEYPRKGLHSIGFVTTRTKGEVQGRTRKDLINVFVPTTPNPTSGVLVFTDPKELVELDMTIEDGMKLVVSGGVVAPPYIK